ncbi:MAG TPA: hypothetical protein VGL39_27750 [Jatrophihabitantaceae bacterium]
MTHAPHRLFCCYLDTAAQAEIASWQPLDASASDAEHQRRHDRVRELTCQDVGDIFELIDGPSPDDYTHSCRTHLGVMVSDENTTAVNLRQAAQS